MNEDITADFQRQMSDLAKSVAGGGFAPRDNSGGGLRMSGTISDHTPGGPSALDRADTVFDHVAQVAHLPTVTIKIFAIIFLGIVLRLAFVSFMTSGAMIQARETRQLPYWVPLTGLLFGCLLLASGLIQLPKALAGSTDTRAAGTRIAEVSVIEVTHVDQGRPCTRGTRACPPPARPPTIEAAAD